MAKQAEFVAQTVEEIQEACQAFCREHDEANGGNYCGIQQNANRIALYVHDHLRDHFTPENIKKAFDALDKQLKLIKTREEEAALSADDWILYCANNGTRTENEFGRFMGNELPPRLEVSSPKPRHDGRVHSLSESRIDLEEKPWERGEVLTQMEYARLSAEDVKRLHVWLDRNNVAFSKVVR